MKHTPFLLYKCKRKESVRNADHVCKLISHKEYLTLNEKLSNSGKKIPRERKKRVSSMILMLTTPGLINIITVFCILE